MGSQDATEHGKQPEAMCGCHERVRLLPREATGSTGATGGNRTQREATGSNGKPREATGVGNFWGGSRIIRGVAHHQMCVVSHPHKRGVAHLQGRGTAHHQSNGGSI